MDERSMSRPIGGRAHQARTMRGLGTVGGVDVKDRGERDDHDRRQDRIFSLETVVVILCVVAGVVAFAVGVF